MIELFERSSCALTIKKSLFKSVFSDFLSSDDLLIGPELEDQIRFAQGRRKSSSALIQQDQRRRNSRFWDFLAAKSDRKTQNLELSKKFFSRSRAVRALFVTCLVHFFTDFSGDSDL